MSRSRLHSADPSEDCDFPAALAKAANPLDFRADEVLSHSGLTDSDSVVREQGLFELASRQGPNAFAVLAQAFAHDPDAMVRQNLLWAIQKTGAPEALDLIAGAKADPDPDVREWAHIFTEEMSSSDTRVTFRDNSREGRALSNKLFDQTLLLHICCDLYIRLDDQGTQWGKMRLSPLALARIFGQAYACPMVATRNKQIVVSKELKGLRKEDYYESFLFRGFTDRTDPTMGNFFFESSGPRVFFPSGKAEDFSQGVIRDVTVTFAREGQWFLDPNLPLNGDLAIRYVRGTFQGWGFVNLQRILASGQLDPIQPGNALLSTLHHREVGPLTNTFLRGTFKGRLRDVDGDGVLEFNPFDIHSTLAGEVDSDLDGVPDHSGVSMASRAYQK